MTLKTYYFGDPKFRKDYEIQIAAPTDKTCDHCGEHFAECDTGTVNFAGQAMHYECQIRLVAGSVGHQLGRCSCHGGDQEDPPGLTRRQAAQAATDLFHSRQFDD